MNCAPIALFVYNRLDKVKEVIRYLKNNIYAGDSDLFIFSDGPKDNEDSYNKVKEVRKFIETIDGFKNVSIIKSEKNKGLANSIIDGVTKVVNEYGKIIVLEDDLITSKFFLKYINDGLNYYENIDDVISVHGFVYPIKSKLPETFFLKGADCWGWGTWKRGWDLFEKDGQKLLDELKKRELTYDFNFYDSYGYTKMLEDQILGKNDSWAIRWYASAYINNKLTLYPGRSLIGNIGMDEGTNCSGGDNILNITDREVTIGGIEIKENIKVKKIIAREYFNNSKIMLPLFINLYRKILSRFFK